MLLSEYTGPGYHEKNRTNLRKAWNKAHSMQSDIEYLLGERKSKDINVSKHMLEWIGLDIDNAKRS